MRADVARKYRSYAKNVKYGFTGGLLSIGKDRARISWGDIQRTYRRHLYMRGQQKGLDPESHGSHGAMGTDNLFFGGWGRPFSSGAMGTDNLFFGGWGRPFSRGNALAYSVARHGVARFRSPWERGRPGRRGKQDENMSPAEARRAQRHSLPVPRLQPGNARHRTRMTRKIAPRRGALQKRRRMRSSGNHKVTTQVPARGGRAPE